MTESFDEIVLRYRRASKERAGTGWRAELFGVLLRLDDGDDRVSLIEASGYGVTCHGLCVSNGSPEVVVSCMSSLWTRSAGPESTRYELRSTHRLVPDRPTSAIELYDGLVAAYLGEFPPFHETDVAKATWEPETIARAKIAHAQRVASARARAVASFERWSR